MGERGSRTFIPGGRGATTGATTIGAISPAILKSEKQQNKKVKTSYEPRPMRCSRDCVGKLTFKDSITILCMHIYMYVREQ